MPALSAQKIRIVCPFSGKIPTTSYGLICRVKMNLDTQKFLNFSLNQLLAYLYLVHHLNTHSYQDGYLIAKVPVALQTKQNGYLWQDQILASIQRNCLIRPFLMLTIPQTQTFPNHSHQRYTNALLHEFRNWLSLNFSSVLIDKLHFLLILNFPLPFKI